MPTGFTTYAQRFSTIVYSNNSRFEGYNAACDYTIAFSNMVVDTSLDVPGLATPLFLNCSSFNTTTNQPLKVIAASDAGYLTIIFTEHGPGTLGATWEITMVSQTATLPTLSGDTLFITSTKGFSFRDTLLVDSKLLEVHRIEMTSRTFRLDQNFPNPFNPTTVISYQLPAVGHATLRIFDLLGREVATLVDQEKPAGVYRETWDASRMASGVYFCRLNYGAFTQTRKLLLIK
jgi:hypothetical protein